MNNIPYYSKMIHSDDERIDSYRHDIVMSGSPAAVFCPDNEKELSEVLSYCNSERVPVTICGSRTSLTGSSVAENGLLIAMEKMNNIVDIDVKRKEVIVKAGIILADFQNKLLELGLLYPPDPTSRNEAQLGSTVATNATGEDSLYYGSTRSYVRALKIMRADGSTFCLRRSLPCISQKGKNHAGYYLSAEEIDSFIGSEGTLGVITELTVSVLSDTAEHFAGVAFFPNIRSALKFVSSVNLETEIEPLCLEIMDDNCLSILRTHPDCFLIPEDAGAMIYFKQKYLSNSDRTRSFDKWYKVLEFRLRNDSALDLLQGSFIVTEENKKRLLRELRHYVPEQINEIVRKYQKDGGGKIATDWWVPVKKIEKMMETVKIEIEQLGLPYFIFGHIGNGHPHINFLAKNKEQKQIVQELIVRQCKRAVHYGGSVAGEHGIGKTKRTLLSIQHDQNTINKMIAIKKQYDPNWILGRNNLFEFREIK